MRGALIAGLVLITLGILIFVSHYIVLYECAHSPQPRSCVNPSIVWGDYEIPIAWFQTGFLVLIGIGFLVFHYLRGIFRD